jgi:hypothetical protein
MPNAILCFLLALVAWFVAMRRTHCFMGGRTVSTALMAGLEELLGVLSVWLAVKSDDPVAVVALALGAVVGVQLERRSS